MTPKERELRNHIDPEGAKPKVLSKRIHMPEGINQRILMYQKDQEISSFTPALFEIIRAGLEAKGY